MMKKTKLSWLIKNQNEFLENRIINWNQAKKWTYDKETHTNIKRSKMDFNGTWIKF